MNKGQLINASIVVMMIVLGDAFGTIVRTDQNAQNTISEEERRGAPTKSIADNDDSDKKTRGIHSVSASHKHHHYFVPSDYDSHLAATGHAFGGGVPGHDFGGHADHHQHGHSGYGTLSGYGGGYNSNGYGHSSGIGSSTSLGSSGNGHGGGHGASFGISEHGGGGFQNVLALKSLLIPLAGIALLGAAAALTTNPVLLQLGVVNGRRRRRSTQSLYNHHHYPPNLFVRPE